MKESEVREEFENLWRDTFGDSSEYVELVMDRYFKLENVEYHEENRELVSALLKIPYVFKTNEGRNLRGLYICGVATLPEYRKRGIMSRLLDTAARKAEAEGFDFTFLIPQSAWTRDYYKSRGYQDTFYKIEQHYVHGHRFSNAQGLALKRYDKSLKTQTVKFLLRNEAERILNGGTLLMQHNVDDWNTVLEETIVSSTPVYLGMVDGDIESVAFLDSLSKTEKDAVRVKHIFSVSEEKEWALLKSLEEMFPDKNVTVVKEASNLRGKENQIWSPFYAVNNGPKEEYEDISSREEQYDPMSAAYSYGMVKIFSIRKFLMQVGIKNEEEFTGYSDDELTRLLLRRPSTKSEDTLYKTLGLPEIDFEASLLLD